MPHESSVFGTLSRLRRAHRSPGRLGLPRAALAALAPAGLWRQRHPVTPDRPRPHL